MARKKVPYPVLGKAQPSRPQAGTPVGGDSYLSVLYDPKTRPVVGLNTALHPMALPEGVVQALTNYRIGNAILEARGGMSAVLSSISTTAEYRGHWAGYVWGAYYTVVAVYDTGVSKTRVYADADHSGSWTELTASSGKYGDTRLTNNTLVRFAVVPNPINTPYATGGNALAFADGGAIRVATALGSATTAIVYEIPPQTDASTSSVRMASVEFYDEIGTGSGETFLGKESDDSTNQTRFILSATGSAPNRQFRLTIQTGVTLDDITKVDRGMEFVSDAAADSPNDRWYLLGLDTAYTNFWDKVKLELRTAATGGTVKVLWDPLNPDDYSRPIPVQVDGTNKTLWLIKFPKITTAINYTHTIFRWVAPTNEAPAANVTVDIWLMALTYGSHGKLDWSIAVANCNSGARNESAGVIFGGEYITDRIKDIGGPVLSELKLPRHPLIDCVIYAKVKGVATADLDKGVDTFNFYYRDTGATRYKLYDQNLNGSYAGSWSQTLTAATFGEVNTGPDFEYVSGQSSVYMPDAWHVSAPNAAELCWANDRLWVGQVANSQEALMISEYKHPFRFRKFTDRSKGAPEPDAPVTHNMGQENVKAIVPLSSSILGSDTVFVFGEQGGYVGNGNDASSLQRLSRVTKFGTISPYSVQELNGKIFYLDTEMQVRELAGGSPRSITRSWVDNNLAGIPASYRQYASGCVWDDKYYLAFAPSGATTNTRILVWDDEDRQWTLDAPPQAAQGILSWFDGTNKKKRLIVIGPHTSPSTTLASYEYDLSTQAQDLGTTNITTTLTFPEITLPDGGTFEITEIGIQCDDVASGTASAVVTYKPTGGTATFSASTDVTDNQVVRMLMDPTVSGTSRGVSATISLSLGMQAANKVYKIVATLKPTGQIYDTA